MFHTIKLFIANLKYAINITYHASKVLFIFKIFCSSCLTCTAFFYLYLWKIVINHLEEVQRTKQDLNELAIMVAVYIFIYVLDLFLKRFQEYINNLYNDAINKYLDNIIALKVSKAEYTLFDSNNLLDNIQDSWTLVNGIQSLTFGIFDFFQSAAQMIIAVYLLAALNLWIVFGIILVILPAMYLQKKSNDLQWKYDRKTAEFSRRMEYYKQCLSLDSIMEIKLYEAYDYFINKYKDTWKQWYKYRKQTAFKTNMISICSMSLLFTAEAFLLINLVIMLKSGILLLGDAVYYISLMSNVRKSVDGCIQIVINMRYHFNELKKIKEILNLKEDYSGGDEKPGRIPVIEFKEVNFRYPNTNNYVINNCSFTIKKGEKIGLVGLNGSGKSTIVKLLLGLYEPTEGKILFDNVDINQYDKSLLRQIFGVIFQDYAVYSMSFRETISLCNRNLYNQDKDLWRACALGKMERLIHSWEKELDTQLTRRFDMKGKELSGGEWQRTSLIRSFAGEKDIFILDEPSSSIDPKTEHEIFELFCKINKNKSSLLISHRLTNIKDVDTILYLEDGKIIEMGNHQTLMSQNGKYAKLYRLQAEKYTN